MENTFIYGMKVTLGNENGIVVIDDLDEPNFCGVIRWDTPKENDTEDWRGLFGTFIQIGGKIIRDDHPFQFIKDDGSLK
ncbi:hypothetical protein [Flavobacterium quisquiliarum]|jgi:hypothetical protein|uniref:YopX protein domain-containing protein n=1 Tax=Flavobacterium quisquiliarum TaxID=1834436 RepID=A0ABV8W101_9FLAO|nr:hypothetical protein [Flavobacterium quisquiliarum]MBW1655806.1 hypothetical protein [Flavobacterium quisquiliarum]NWL01447.1 hypothetical protein [Flavobacterium collinsii]